MTIEELSEQFDVLYNNITSNQAPGLNEYEKSVFLTKAEKEVVKNYFSAQSPGNTLKLGFDDSAKRQADFSVLMQTAECTKVSVAESIKKIDYRSTLYTYPTNVFIVINEALYHTQSGNYDKTLQILPLRYDEYTRLMSKPYKRPLKYQAWRLINSAVMGDNTSDDTDFQTMPAATRYVEILAGPSEASNSTNNSVLEDDNNWKYVVRYIRMPKPIIVGNLDGLTIDGVSAVSEYCEIDPILHEDILQRAVELAKIAWTATGQDNTNAMMAAGQRSE